MPTTSINGLSLFYQKQGTGPALVSIHGGFGGAATTVLPWQETWPDTFLDAYTVVTYDRRSSGRSDYPESDHTLAAFASDLRGLLEHLHISQAYVMGSSAGGPIALTYALTDPHSVLGLCLINTSAHVARDLGVVETVRRRMALLRQQGPEAAFAEIEQDPTGGVVGRQPWMQGIYRGALTPELQRRQEEAQRRLAGLSRPERMKYTLGELRNYAAYVDVDLTPRLSEVKVPTLVVHGDADMVLPLASGQELAARVPKAELVVIPEAGHGLLNYPGVPQKVRAFLNQLAVAARP